MDRLAAARVVTVQLAIASIATSSIAMASQTSAAPPGTEGGDWSATLLTQTDDVPALAAGVAVGPDSVVTVGGMTCERTRSDDLGRCWGQPWVSWDGSTWEAVEARTSGLDLGHFRAVTSGPEVGLDGVAYGPGGFVAFGWAEAKPEDAAGTGSFGVTPALWRSNDGASWERLPTPATFLGEGPAVSGAWPTTIVGTESGYLLGGTLYDTPAPRGAIWASPDGLNWTLTGPDEAFDIGGYVDTLEVPAAGAIAAIAVAPQDGPRPGSAIAVGDACPGPTRWARPKGAWARAFEWTPGDCAARIWRSADGRTWTADHFRPAEGADLALVPYEARSVATTGQRDIVCVAPDRVLVSDDGWTWDVARPGEVGRQRALATLGGRFYAMVPECVVSGCRRKTLALWSSDDAATWTRHPSQPALPVGALDFVDADMAAAGDRLVVSVGLFAAPHGELASVALVSPRLSESTAGEAGVSPLPDASPGRLVTLPPADAAQLPESVAPPAGSRLAYVRDVGTRRMAVHVVGADGRDDTRVARGNRPSWAPDGQTLAHDCRPRTGAGFPGLICLTDVASGATEPVIERAWGPQWSPAGLSIAFGRSTFDLGDAFVEALETLATTRLPGSDPRWSPTGEWLHVTVGRGVPVVAVVRPDGTDAHVLGPGWTPAWSPDGTRIAVTWSDGRSTTVSAMDVASGTADPLFSVAGWIAALRWLPGDRLAFVASADDALGGDLYLIDLGDSTARSLTSGMTVGQDLTVSPDGDWLAFGATKDGARDIYLASAAGGWAAVTTSGHASQPRWAPVTEVEGYQ